jgi:hypothetical protein
LPSLEAFQKGIKIPTVHMVFYDFFLKATVGESQWKATCLSPCDAAMPLVDRPLETFAMILLKNNYFAWLCTAKEKLQDSLVTDYDAESIRSGMKNFSDILLKDMEINLVRFSQGNNNDILATDEEDDEDVDRILISSSEPTYSELRKQTEEQLLIIRQEASANEKYKEIVQELAKSRGVVTEEDDDDREVSEEERVNRRKLLKKLRVYTNPKETDRFKGWSKDASADQKEMMTTIMQNEKEYKKFRVAYRFLFAMKQGTSKKRKSLQEAPDIDFVNDVWLATPRQRVEI